MQKNNHREHENKNNAILQNSFIIKANLITHSLFNWKFHSYTFFFKKLYLFPVNQSDFSHIHLYKYIYLRNFNVFKQDTFS